MKQIGLGIHNFHDTMNGVPPASISNCRASLHVLLFPFMEQTSLYNSAFDSTDRWGCGLQYDGGGVGVNRMFLNITGNEISGEWQLASSWNTSDSGAGTWWTAVLTRPEDRSAFGSVPFLKCPSRRGGTSVSEAINVLAGPTTDYGFVLAWAAGNPSWNGLNEFQRLGFVAAPWDCLRSDLSNMLSICHGPFRASVITPDYTSHSSYSKPTALGISSWNPRDSMVWWRDGTSNQLIFGEKFIPLDKVGSCSLSNGHWDCGFMGMSVPRPEPVARAFKYGAGNSSPLLFPTVAGTPSGLDGLRSSSFGSWHSGVCNFVLGDGAVRAISVTTAVEGVLYPLSVCDDGSSASLP
jgi:hypothetical protein